MVLKRVRGGFRTLRAPFVGSRVLALLAGVVVGIGAAMAAVTFAHPSFVALLAVPFGVGGSTYYGLHYQRLLPTDSEPFGRAFVRIFAMILIFQLVDDAPIDVVLPELVGVAGLLLLIMYSTATHASRSTEPSSASLDNE